MANLIFTVLLEFGRSHNLVSRRAVLRGHKSTRRAVSVSGAIGVGGWLRLSWSHREVILLPPVPTLLRVVVEFVILSRKKLDGSVRFCQELCILVIW
jgi:hypothetical protein